MTDTHHGSVPVITPAAISWRAAFQTPHVWLWEMVAACLGGLWFGAAGPFGVYHRGPLETRLLCFGLLTPLVVAFFGLGNRTAVKLGSELRMPPAITLTASVGILSLPASMLIASFVPLFLAIRPPPSLPSFEWYVQTLVIMLPTTLASHALQVMLTKRAPSKVAEASKTGEFNCRLAKRLPISCRSRILALQAEDHYVRVITETGSQLLLMRLSDAIAELDGLEGLRVHRSWWVARSAIADANLKARGATVTLVNGQDVPVARNQVALLRQL